MVPVSRNGLQRPTVIIADVNDERLPAMAHSSLIILASQLQLVDEPVLENERRVKMSVQATDIGWRLMEVLGVGSVLVSAIVASAPTPWRSDQEEISRPGSASFLSGTPVAAKRSWGGITKQGDRYLRQLLVVGPLSVIRYTQRHGTRRPWLVAPLSRRSSKIAAVALANKMTRMIWAMMMTENATEGRFSSATPADSELGEGNCDVMRPPADTESGKPIRAMAPRARAFGRDPAPRKTLWPAAHARRINRPHTWPH